MWLKLSLNLLRTRGWTPTLTQPLQLLHKWKHKSEARLHLCPTHRLLHCAQMKRQLTHHRRWLRRQRQVPRQRQRQAQRQRQDRLRRPGCRRKRTLIMLMEAKQPLRRHRRRTCLSLLLIQLLWSLRRLQPQRLRLLRLLFPFQLPRLMSSMPQLLSQKRQTQMQPASLPRQQLRQQLRLLQLPQLPRLSHRCRRSSHRLGLQQPHLLR